MAGSSAGKVDFDRGAAFQHVVQLLQQLLWDASVELFGKRAAETWTRLRGRPVAREAVRLRGAAGRRRGGGGDLCCALAIGTFKRLQLAGRPGSDLGFTASGSEGHQPATVLTAPAGTVKLTVTSKFGVTREWDFDRPAALAEALLNALDLPSELIVDARVDSETGELRFITQFEYERQRGLGRLLCTSCGSFFAGEKGLRHHQQIQHGASYETGQAVALLASQGQLVASQTMHPTVAAWRAAVFAMAEAERGRLVAGRTTMHPGLALARDGALEKLREMHRCGAWSSDVVDRHGSCALHWAAGSGHLCVCRWLAEDCGIAPSICQKKDGRNALHWSCRNGHLEVCRWLVGTGQVNPSHPTLDGTTPFHWAVWQGHTTICEWLIEAGADWKAKNSFGCNAVQWAALSGSIRMCVFLKERGLDIGLLNNNGHSALHKAASKGHMPVCEWLLSAEGGLSAVHLQPDGDGNTPAKIAGLEGHPNLECLLQQHINAFTKCDAAPCHTFT